MPINITQLESCLRSMSIDTGKEQKLLSGISCQQAEDTILITGDPQADIYTLIPAPEQLLFADESIPFPLTVEYAEAFSVQVFFDSSTEIYHSVRDFRQFCRDRFADIHRCEVCIPDELLRQNHLIFFTLDHNISQLTDFCMHCTGCVIVAAADAGGLSEDYLDLCRWLSEERCISKRVTLLLNHSGVFDNPALEFMAQTVLNRKKLGVIRCGTEDQTGTFALKAAVYDIQERSMEGVADAVMLSCCSQIRLRLQDAILEEQKTAQSNQVLAEKYRSAGKTYNAMCVTEAYAFAEILTKEEQENLRREIKAMFNRLRSCFPQMVDEVLFKSANPKQDLKNLSGDYLGALIDAYVEEILNEVLEDLLIPRTRDRFHDLCDRFRRMMQDADLEYEQIENHARTVLLKMGDVNIGDYHTPLAEIAATVITAFLKMSLTALLSKVGLGDWGYYIGVRLGDVINSAATELADMVTPAKYYAGNVTKVLMKQTDDLEQTILLQIQDTIIPRMSGVLQSEFETLVDVYRDQLQRKAEHYHTLNARAQERIAALTADLAALNALDPVQ